MQNKLKYIYTGSKNQIHFGLVSLYMVLNMHEESIKQVKPIPKKSNKSCYAFNNINHVHHQYSALANWTTTLGYAFVKTNQVESRKVMA